MFVGKWTVWSCFLGLKLIFPVQVEFQNLLEQRLLGQKQNPGILITLSSHCYIFTYPNDEITHFN